MTRTFSAFGAAIALASAAAFAQSDPAARIDTVFARYSAASPGCAVGVASAGTVVERA